MALPNSAIAPDFAALAERQMRVPVQKGVRRDVCWSSREKALVDDQAKTAEFVINSDQDDRDEEVVLPLAVLEAAKDYLENNPIFLWGHAHRGTPEMAIGTCLSITGDATLVRAKFQYDTEIPGLADGVFARVKKGTIRSVSIGFIPKRWVTRNSPQADIDALPLHVAQALTAGKIWLVHTAIELIEISQCFIGSNRQALALTLQFGDQLVARMLELMKTPNATINPEAPVSVPKTAPATAAPNPEEKAVDAAADGTTTEASTADAADPVDEKLADPAPSDEKTVEESPSLEDQVKELKAQVAELTETVSSLLVERMIARL
jgi:hypothetical protein